MRIRLLSAAALLAFAAAPAFAAPLTYKIDPTHTTVLAQWNHFGFSNPSASFGNVEGTLVYDAADVARSSVEVTLPLSGLEGFSAKFNEHLRSADFFDAAKFPKATFKSTKVEAAGEGKLKVTGLEPASGDSMGGQIVVINGQGFMKTTRTAKVYFGDQAGNVIRFRNDGELIVEAPGGKPDLTVDVLVVFEPGGEITIPKAYTFREKKSLEVKDLGTK